MNLNARALKIVENMIASADERRVAVSTVEGGGRVVDCGIAARGGLLAGLDLARVCMAGLAEASIGPGHVGGRPVASVRVATDHPAAACLRSQYAGWQLAAGKFFAMGSGPMRAASGREAIFGKLGGREEAGAVVGVLEGRKLPTAEVVSLVADACRVAPKDVHLVIAPTASLAGGVQVVARSVETALHKLGELGFDLGRIVSGHGVAPLPPVAADDLAAIGRTNDAVLYGAEVILYVTGDDDTIADIGPEVPSSASADHGEPFAAIFERYGRDFYKVDPHLFSPALVSFQNLDTGRTHTFGHVDDAILSRSFFG